MKLNNVELPHPTSYRQQYIMDGIRRRSLSGAYHFRAYSTGKKRSSFSITFDAISSGDCATILSAWSACISSSVTFEDINNTSYNVLASGRPNVEPAYGGLYRVSIELEEA